MGASSRPKDVLAATEVAAGGAREALLLPCSGPLPGILLAGSPRARSGTSTTAIPAEPSKAAAAWARTPSAAPVTPPVPSSAADRSVSCINDCIAAASPVLTTQSFCPAELPSQDVPLLPGLVSTLTPATPLAMRSSAAAAVATVRPWGAWAHACLTTSSAGPMRRYRGRLLPTTPALKGPTCSAVRGCTRPCHQ